MDTRKAFPVRGATWLAASALALSMVSGCAAPLVTPNPLTMQYKAAHTSDWLNLARRTVDALPSSSLTEKPRVFVAPGPADMAFANAYRTYLEQALSERGFQVVESSQDAVVLNF